MVTGPADNGDSNRVIIHL